MFQNWQPTIVYERPIPHPTNVFETTNMANTPLPRLRTPTNERFQIDADVISSMQRETIDYAIQSLTTSAEKCFFLGDATGTGKSRIIAGIIIHLNRTTHLTTIWISANRGLWKDATSEMSLLDKTATERMVAEDTILFSTYSLLARNDNLKDLVASLKKRQTKILIVFDEAHLARNCSKSASAVIDLQEIFGDAMVVYSTATAASDISHLQYMTRLQLWGGPRSAFRTFSEFTKAMKSCGPGGMELLAVELKQRGLYMSRQLSLEGIEYTVEQCELDQSERAMYDKCARIWTQLEGDVHATLKIAFFKQLLGAMKGRHVIRIIRESLEAGYAVIVAVQSTGEAATVRQTKRATATSATATATSATATATSATATATSATAASTTAAESLATYARSCRDMLEQNGVSDKDLLEQIPLDLVDAIISEFGADSVAEITGRVSRYVPGPDGVARFGRCPSNEEETEAFQRGVKNIAIISRAGSTGISLHASNTCGNQRPRIHVVAELPWSANDFVQQCGRSHRTNQTSVPKYVLLGSDVPAEIRFIYTIVERLRMLGAMSRGDRGSMLYGMRDVEEIGNLPAKSIRRFAFELAFRRACDIIVNATKKPIDITTHRLPTASQKTRLRLGNVRTNEQLMFQHINSAIEYYESTAANTAADAAADAAAANSGSDESERVLLDESPLINLTKMVSIAERLFPFTVPWIDGTWSKTTHNLFPTMFKRICKTVLCASQRAECSKTLGAISNNLLCEILSFAADCGVRESTLRTTRTSSASPAIDVKRLYDMTAKEMLNGLLANELHVQAFYQQNLIVHVIDQEATNGVGKVYDIADFVLRSCSRTEFAVVCPSIVPVDATTVAVHVSVSHIPPPEDATIIKPNTVFAKRNLARGLCGIVKRVERTTERNWDVEIWYPGRSRPARVFTDEHWENELRSGTYVPTTCSQMAWNVSLSQYTRTQSTRAKNMCTTIHLVVSNILHYTKKVLNQEKELIVLRGSREMCGRPVLGLYRWPGVGA
jgi:hypothetical protein